MIHVSRDVQHDAIGMCCVLTVGVAVVTYLDAMRLAEDVLLIAPQRGVV